MGVVESLQESANPRLTAGTNNVEPEQGLTLQLKAAQIAVTQTDVD